MVLGLHHGIPHSRQHLYQPYQLPDTVVIYAETIETLTSNQEDKKRFVIETLLHELGHYFGVSEEELRRVSQK